MARLEQLILLGLCGVVALHYDNIVTVVLLPVVVLRFGVEVCMLDYILEEDPEVT